MKKLVAVILTFLLVLTGCSKVKVTKVKDDIKTDGIRFSEEYKTISNNNLFEYSTYNNIIEVLNNGTGIIYLGFPECTLCKEIVPIINDACKEKKVKTIMYYNFKEIRNSNTEEYQKLANILSDYIKVDEEGIKRITAPTIIFVNKGNISSVYIGTYDSNEEEIIVEEKKEELKNNFKSLIDKMYTIETTTQAE